MNSYEVNGIRLESELEFPELLPSGGSPDAHLRIRPLGIAPSADDVGPNWARSTPDETIWMWAEFAAVRVRGGREITVDPWPDISLPLLRATLLGPVFSVLLIQRGLFPLHACSLIAHEHAIAIAGPAGSGKSSLAAAMKASGHRILADDVTATRVVDGRAEIFPGTPRLRLTPATLDWLGEPAGELPAVPGSNGKRVYPVRGVADHGPIPLARIYSIHEGPEPGIEALPEQEAFLEISRNCHRPELTVGAIGPGSFLQRCAELARAIPVYRLVRPWTLDRLGELARRLEAHVVQ